MRKIIYPGIFYKENNSYWVEFPDLEGCQSFGDTLEEIYLNAKVALGTYCITLLEQGRELAKSSDIFSITVPKSAFVSLVDTDLAVLGNVMKQSHIKETA